MGRNHTKIDTFGGNHQQKSSFCGYETSLIKRIPIVQSVQYDKPYDSNRNSKTQGIYGHCQDIGGCKEIIS